MIRKTTLQTEDTAYANPFVGPIDHTTHVTVDVSTLTSVQVDADGFLKPGVPLTAAGDRITSIEGGETVASVAGGAAGDHTVTGISTDDELLSVVAEHTSTGVTTDLTDEFTITAADTINNAGGTSSATNVLFVRYRDASATVKAHGVTVEAARVHTSNTGLSSVTADVPVAVATVCQVNRAIAEDNLGSAYTAAEVAAMEAAATIKLLS